MAVSETSPLVLQNGDDAVIMSMPDATRHRELSKRKVLVAVLVGLCISLMTLQNSRTASVVQSSSSIHQDHHQHDDESSRFDVDSFIHTFERENTKQMSFNLHYHHDKGKLDHLLYFNGTSAYEDLVTDKESSALDFFNYVQGGWDAQINQGYCPIASSAAILNSLRGRIELPQDPTYM
jgi:hypothetical protein